MRDIVVIKKLYVQVFLAVASVFFFKTNIGEARGVPVKCGDIIEGEFTAVKQSISHDIKLSPGDSLEVFGGRIGDYLRYEIDVIAPSNTHVFGSSNWDINFGNQDKLPLAKTAVLSERGVYKIQVFNGGKGYNYGGERLGIYTLSVGCKLKDGTEIKPGDNHIESAKTANQLSAAAQLNVSESFSGFPGLRPVDFSPFSFPELPVDNHIKGKISAKEDQIFGYIFEAQKEKRLDLEITKTSGNLNIGFVVLSGKNKVIFQASLVTSQSLSTSIEIPSAGKYTIGAFRIELLPPSIPEDTTFTIKGSLK
jgi:hypothetical protein